MEFQFHPASARATVRTVPLSVAGQRGLVALSGVAALAAVSLWLTVPLSLRRHPQGAALARPSSSNAWEGGPRGERSKSQELALDNGDHEPNRFLYDVAPACGLVS
jgi:hypothetical protein